MDKEKLIKMFKDFGATVEVEDNIVCVDAIIGCVWFNFDKDGKFVQIVTGE